MKRKHYPVEQIIAVLKQAELGMAAGDIVRQLGISEQTFYRWKKQYSGVQSEQVKELKQLQDENTRLKKLVAELSQDKAIPQVPAQPKRSQAGAGPMAASSPAICWTCGPTITSARSTSAVLAKRPTTASSNRSTGRCAMNASTTTGSLLWQMQNRSSRLGDWTTMRVGLTRLSMG